MIKFHTLLTQPIIVVRIGSMWNFDRWKWAALSNTMLVEVFKPNDPFPSLCDFRCIPVRTVLLSFCSSFCTGTLQSAGVIQAAYELNNPLDVRSVNLPKGVMESVSFFSVDTPQVILETVKKVDNPYIILETVKKVDNP
jgi:hypothetical protein